MVNEELRNALFILQKGGKILYPTDTVWGIGCDATDADSIKKIYQIKQRSESKSLIVLVDSFEMLKNYVKEIPDNLETILLKNKKSTTIIYNNPVGIAKNCIAQDNTIAIRIVKEGFCHELINQFKKPIVSTSANVSGKSTPLRFEEIEVSILDNVDYAVNLHRDKSCNSPSTILKLDLNGNIITIRE